MRQLFEAFNAFFGKQERTRVWLFRIVVALLVLLPVFLAGQTNHRSSPLICGTVFLVGLFLGVLIIVFLETIRKQQQWQTAALSQAEDKLRQFQKMEALGRLTGGIVHDFNNLLTLITSYSELLLKKLSPEDSMFEDASEIHEAGERAVVLVHQLLAFSRRQILKPKILNLNRVAEGMEKMLQSLMGEGIVLKMTLDPALGTVRADPEQMEQVIMNLSLNGRDAMPNGGKMTLETRNIELGESYCRDHPEVTPGRYAMLAVTDTGSGMDRPTLEKVFEPFFTTKERGKGTGLGLSTVYGIVKQSGGSIFVYSEVGRGTSFKIYLPRVDKKTILLIEDEKKLGKMIRNILERQGYTVLSAVNGEETDRLTREYEGKIDLLVTDLTLPGESGPDLAKRLMARDPALQVLYTSGYTDETVVRHGLLAEKAAFLQKPFTPEILIQKVREVLGGTLK